MRNIKIKLTVHDLYYCGLFLYVFAMNIQYSYAHNMWVLSGSPILKVLTLMKYTAYLFCILHLLTIKKVNVFTFAAVILFFVAAIYATHTGPQRAPIYYFLMLITSINTDFKKCVKIFLSIQLTTFIMYLFLSFLNISGSSIVETFGRQRRFLGYGWVNRASYSWFFICLEIFFLKKNKITPQMGLLLGIVNFFVFYNTNTMFSMLMTFGVIGIGLVNYFGKSRGLKKKQINYRLLYRFSTAMFIVTIVIGIVLPMIYNPGNPVMYQFNRIVTGRLALGKMAILRYGLHLGGNKLQWVGSSTLMFGLNSGTEYFYVDNGFLQLALEFGILFTAFIAFIYLASIKKACMMENFELVVIILILDILFVFEPYTVDFAFNPFPLFFFSTISLRATGKLIHYKLHMYRKRL